MPTAGVIEAVDVLKDGGLGLAVRFPSPAPDQLGLDRPEEGFDGGIVIEITLAAHRYLEAVFALDLLVVVQTILAAPVAVEDAALGRRPQGNGHLQRPDRQVALHAIALTTSDAARRAEVLAEGEARLQAGSVGHNCCRFHCHAMEANVNVSSWGEVRRHAGLLSACPVDEPMPWSEFFIARAISMADAAGGHDADARLRTLRSQAEAAGPRIAIPGIDRALAALTAYAHHASA